MQLLTHEVTESYDKLNDTIRTHNNRLNDMEKKVSFVVDLNKTFTRITTNFNDSIAKVATENTNNREKLQKMILEMETKND